MPVSMAGTKGGMGRKIGRDQLSIVKGPTNSHTGAGNTRAQGMRILMEKAVKSIMVVLEILKFCKGTCFEAHMHCFEVYCIRIQPPARKP